jgi:hypothetical protein
MKLSKTDFENLLQIVQGDFNRYLVVNTDICKYGQSVPNSVDIEKSTKTFLDFYYPLYENDFEDNLEAQGLPY